MTPVALTIAGSDPSGGAGIQADLKTFHQFGVYGQAVITLLTVQNTVSVSAVEPLSGDLVGRQLDAVLSDIRPGAAKTGALGTVEIIETVAARDLPILVVDPVMISKHGSALLGADARDALIRLLLPRAFLVTPNLPEAASLCGGEFPPREAARRIRDLGPRAVLIKGGHSGTDANDLLFDDAGFHLLPAERIDTRHTHGTGCSYAAAIAALLAGGTPLLESVARAKTWITEAIRTNPGLGAGSGPVNHFSSVK